MKALAFDDVETIDIHKAAQLIEETNGRFFRVEFLKRGNGAYRRMIARTGVKPNNPNGNGKRYRPSDHGLIVVWEPANAYVHDGNDHDDGYRSIGIERIQALRIRGKTYRVIAPETV